MHPYNGILGAIPGQYIAAGSLSLPPAADHRGEELTAEVDTGALWRGLVRIRYVSEKMRAGRHSHWAWVAVHAERV